MLSLNDIDSAISSVAIKSEAGQELAIDGNGFITITNTSFAVTATDLDIRNLVFATDKVDVSGSSVTVSATDLDIRDLAFATDSVTAHQGGVWTIASDSISSWKVSTETVGLTEGELVSTPLANRFKVEIQNLSSKDIYIAPATGVTTANGFKIPKGSSYENGLSADVDIFAIAGSAGLDVRVAEYAL